MYKTHNGFYPPDDQTTIWRYIDFTKFVDLIHTQSVYFARADKFEDTFEGMYPVKAEIEREFSKYDIIRKHNYLSCWAIGEYESAALWKVVFRLKELNSAAIYIPES